MARPIIFVSLISATFFYSCDGRANAASIEIDIGLPKDCGTFLNVTSKQTKQGLIEFVVRIQPEQATDAGDLYRGRVGTNGRLKISSADTILASMLVHKSSDRDVAEFRFELARQLVKRSVFTVTSSLFEKNGRPSIGGGRTFRIHLDGFLPGDSPHLAK
jgi:hypothetical protein